jgi:hypothetical protein
MRSVEFADHDVAVFDVIESGKKKAYLSLTGLEKLVAICCKEPCPIPERKWNERLEDYKVTLKRWRSVALDRLRYERKSDGNV